MGKIQLFLQHNTESPESSTKVSDTLSLKTFLMSAEVLNFRTFFYFSAYILLVREDTIDMLVYAMSAVGSCWRDKSL